MKHSGRSPLGFYMIGMVALFLAGFLLLVIFGAQTYRTTVSVQSGNNQARALLGYFETCISANDSKGAVHIADSEYGQMLVIPDGDTGYGLRVYCCEGELKETYASLDAAIRPEQDISIGETRIFRMEEVANGLLRITTDAGSIYVSLRSEGNGGAS